MPTDEEIAELLEKVECASPEEPQGDIPEEAEDWQLKYSESEKELSSARARIEVLEEQNKRLFDSMAKMVKSVPVSDKAPEQPKTDAERRKDLVEKYDLRKLDFT